MTEYYVVLTIFCNFNRLNHKSISINLFIILVIKETMENDGKRIDENHLEIDQNF